MSYLCSDKTTVDYCIREEPASFYQVLYNILSNDCKEYNLNSFKHFYIIAKIPLYNNKICQENITLINNKIKSCDTELLGRILKGLKEEELGHGETNSFNCQCSVFPITKYKINTCSHITYNMVHLIVALKQNIDVKNYENILEFGGGYGSMAKLCSDMGFKNKYFIYDLPGIKSIQEFYLNKLNVNNKIINDIDELKTIDITNKKNLFIATWSLSEVDFDIREQIVDIIKDFDAVIIIFQHNIWNRDNFKYFYESGKFQKKFTKISNWVLQNIPHIKWDGGNYYLIGN